jgi:non-structural maintenance of chromosomes element 1
MHYHCFANFRRRHSACPSCSQDWPREAHEKPLLPVGEGAVRDGDDGKRRARARSTEASDDDELTEEDEPASTQPQRKSQRVKKGKAPVNESMDEDEDENGTPETSQKRRRSSRK